MEEQGYVCVCSCLWLSCKSQRKPFSVNHFQLLWQWHTARLWYNHRWMTFHTSVYDFTCIVVPVSYFMCYHLFISGSPLLWKLYIQDRRIRRVCSWVCVFSCAFRQFFVVVCAKCACMCVCLACREILIRNTASRFHQSLSSLFPVFLHISALYRVETPEPQIWMEFAIILIIYVAACYFCLDPQHPIYCCFGLFQYSLYVYVDLRL